MDPDGIPDPARRKLIPVTVGISEQDIETRHMTSITPTAVC